MSRRLVNKSSASAVLQKYGNMTNKTMTDDEWEAHDRRVRLAQMGEARREREKRTRVRGGKVAACGAPYELVRLVVSGKTVRDSQVMKDLDEWQRSAAQPGARICVLAGPVGVGKTVAAVRWLMNFGGIRPGYARAGDFEAVGRYDTEWRAQWRGASGFILDDLGAEYADAKGNLISDLDTLFDVYATGRGRLVVTTNLTWEVFQARYGERISSRIVERATWINVTGPDQRRAS